MLSAFVPVWLAFSAGPILFLFALSITKRSKTSAGA
jgi:hypothetical protein